MAAEGPFVNAIVARSTMPKENLAAFGMAFAVAILIEAPVINMMATAVKIVKDYPTYLQLRRFCLTLSTAVTVVMFFIMLPPVFQFWCVDLLALPPEVSEPTWLGLFCLFPWPFAIGYRRLYQGIIIRTGEGTRVTLGTIIRLIAVLISAAIFTFTGWLEGVALAGTALSVGTISEAIAARLMAQKALNQLERSPPSEETQWTFRKLWQFYHPLATTTLLGLAVPPLVTFAGGKAAYPLESLAAIPVINALMFIFRAIALSFQEVILAILGKPGGEAHLTLLRRFVTGLGILSYVAYFAIAFTPWMFEFWFYQLMGLPSDLGEFLWVPLLLVSLIPGLAIIYSWQRSILIHQGLTKPISGASALELAVVAAILGIGILTTNYSGAVLAMVALSISRGAAAIYLGRAMVLRSHSL